MKIQQTSRAHRRKKLVIGLVIVVVLLVAGGLIYLLFMQKSSPKTANANRTGYSAPTQEQINNGSTIKSNSTNTQSGELKTSGSDQPAAPVASTTGGKSTIDFTITHANQTGGSLSVGTLIGAIVSDGTCTLQFTKTGQATITQTAGVQASNSTSTCEGFTIPTSGLATGTWQLTITYADDTLTGTATQAVTVH